MLGRRLLLVCFVGLLLGAGGTATLSSPERQRQTVVFLSLVIDVGVVRYQQAEALVVAGYHRAPAFVIGLAGLVALPTIALGAVCTRAAAAARRRRRIANAPLVTEPDPNTSLATRPAWLVVESGNRQELRISRELTSIGRGEDNDLMLVDGDVHRHHAVLRRTPDGRFILVDVSGTTGNGIIVDGGPCTQAVLNGGERIAIGRARLSFVRQRTPPSALSRSAQRQDMSNSPLGIGLRV